MYKKLFILALFLLTASFGFARENDTITRYPRELQRAISTLHRMPEARELIANVQKDGAVKVDFAPKSITQQFGACWEAKTRSILLNRERMENEGEIINTILFELHNALASPHLEHLTYLASIGHIEKNAYVEQIERTEYSNAVHTSQILEKGIEQGIYPKTARWPVPRTFDDHYKLQQLHGHSQLIAMQYDEFSPKATRSEFRGTIPGLSQLTSKDKEDMLFFLAIKNDIESPIPELQQRGRDYLHREWTRIQGCRAGTYIGDCSRARQKEQLLRIVFKGNSQFTRLTGS